MIEIELKGFEEVKRALNELPQKIARKVLRAAVKKSGDPIKAALKVAAPIRGKREYARRWVATGAYAHGYSEKYQLRGKKTSKGGRRYPGFLKQKIGNRYRAKKSGPLEVHYGQGPVGDAFYGYIVARGHVVGSRKAARRKTGLGSSVGYVPAIDWISPVFEAHKAITIETMNKNLTAGILKVGEEAGFKTSAGWYFGSPATP